jgi:hypothetical protein
VVCVIVGHWVASFHLLSNEDAWLPIEARLS